MDSAATDMLDHVASWGVAGGFTGKGAGVGESYPPSSIAGEVVGPLDAPGGLTVSVGVASFPTHAATSDELVEAADRAVYRAKERGQNRVEMALEPTSA